MYISIYQSVTSLPERCNAIFEAAKAQSYFFNRSWFELLEAQVFGPDGKTIEVVVVEGTDEIPVAILPLATGLVHGHNSGNHVAGLANYYTSLFSVIFDPVVGLSEEVAIQLIGVLSERRPRFDTVWLWPLDNTCPQYRVLNQALSRSGFAVQEFFSFGNWYLEVAGRSYEQYLDSRPSILKSTISRKSKKFLKSGGRLEIIRCGPAVESGIQAYEKVYSASWKVPEPYPEFMRGLVRMAAQDGALRLGVAYVQDEPVAAQLWLVSDGIASVYKLAYDEKFEALSAGTVLTAHLMQTVIDEDRVNIVDYLTGDDPYKKQWMSHRRERWGLNAFNKSTLAGRYGMMKEIYGSALMKRVLRFTGGLRRSAAAPTAAVTSQQGVRD